MNSSPLKGRKSAIVLGVSLAAGLWGGWAMVKRMGQRHLLSLPMKADVTARTALVTGSSSGIGAAFARQLAARGFNLVLVARREERLKALAEELESRYRIRAEVLAADLSEAGGIRHVEKRVAELADLYLLINNAGFGAPGDFAQIDIHDHVDMINVHVVASVRLTRAALPTMIARGSGAVINVSSVAGFAPIAGHATYSATKAYLILFSEAIQAELKHKGVRIQALCPGFTRSEFHDDLDEEKFDRTGIPEFLWMDADDVAARSLAALSKGEVVYVPSRNYRLVAAAARIVPPRLIQLARSIYAS